jgi:tetratricopeptide (TPR) repeat protein
MRHFLLKTVVALLLAGFLWLLSSHNVVSENSYLNQAVNHFKKGNYKEALEMYDRVSGPDQLAAVAGAIRTRLVIGDYQVAEQTLRRLQTSAPDNETLPDGSFRRCHANSGTRRRQSDRYCLQYGAVRQIA